MEFIAIYVKLLLNHLMANDCWRVARNTTQCVFRYLTICSNEIGKNKKWPNKPRLTLLELPSWKLFISYTVYRFWDIWIQGHPKIFWPFESPYMTSYLTSIHTFSLSRTIFEIFEFKVLRVWPWPLWVIRGQKYFHHLTAHIWLPI